VENTSLTNDHFVNPQTVPIMLLDSQRKSFRLPPARWTRMPPASPSIAYVKTDLCTSSESRSRSSYPVRHVLSSLFSFSCVARRSGLLTISAASWVSPQNREERVRGRIGAAVKTSPHDSVATFLCSLHYGHVKETVDFYLYPSS